MAYKRKYLKNHEIKKFNLKPLNSFMHQQQPTLLICKIFGFLAIDDEDGEDP